MDTQSKRIIDLSEYNNVGIILKLGSGVFYATKAAGLACQYPGIEGAFYPLPVKPGNAELFSLTQRFNGPWNHIEDADAEFIDRVLRRNGHFYFHHRLPAILLFTHQAHPSIAYLMPPIDAIENP
jgi:hypothetical protein